MSKRIKLKLIVMIIIAVFMFLFPCGNKFGYNIHNEDEGPDVSDSSIEWHFTYYSDGNGGLGHKNPNTSSNFVQSDWEVNETYGWHEWEYKGTKYVVVAAATCEGIDELPNPRYPFIDKQSKIHYFHYGLEANNWNYSTFQFKFKNNGDETVYNGIVLDTCELSLDPWDSSWDSLGYGTKPQGTQWLDVHVPLGYPEKDKYNKFNGEEIELTSDGTWNSGKSKSSVRKSNFIRTIIGGLNFIGDSIQMTLDELMNDSKTDADMGDLVLSKSEIESDKELKKQINISTKKKENNTDKNIKKEKEISNKVENKKGNTVIVYNENTKIPVITADMYSACTNKVKLLDVNFFKNDSDNTNKYFKFVRGTILEFCHISLYIGAILMLAMIIIKSILLVKSALGDNPLGARNAKEVIDNITKVIVIVGTIYLFMSLMTNFYDKVISLILNGNESNYLIRVKVTDTYSFNTNFMGYMKYHTMKADVESTFFESLLYAAASGANLVVYIFMFYRLIKMAILTIIAPITAAMTVLNTGNKVNTNSIFNINNWVKNYLKWLWISVLGLILYGFVLFFL